MAKAIQMVESVGREHGVNFPMQGTVAVSDGITVWAFRYSSQRQTRTLFHSADVAALEQMYPDAARLRAFGKRAHVVVSEPLNDLPGAFIEVPELRSPCSTSPDTTTTRSCPTSSSASTPAGRGPLPFGGGGRAWVAGLIAAAKTVRRLGPVPITLAGACSLLRSG